ncbi:MAG: tRNA (guanosine(46)-N7)-methyltransferase TrmB [Candidatus Kapabacteria bacterium]|nr:tRNA (guanosine(46)-N7)-methyltransferase TrmB [Ignavibacteriota bacterium]MCW5884655.1 tRNA (guanosine(46)-N7)-methyltransferase TrmB [Candidatus Kapabacteria bacterium]
MIPVDYKKYPFIAKIRHHVSSNNYLPISDLSIMPENYPEPVEKLNWNNVFINGKKPNVLDIGCGKGVFLISYALENSNENVLGLEIRSEAVEWINMVVSGEQIPNCKALHYTVANGLPFIEDETIESIFYLFPDPWPKRRHYRRRAFTESFLRECYRVLIPNGNLFLATDVDYVHEYQTKVLNKFAKFSLVELSDRSGWNLPSTNKENFCLRKNIPVFRLICSKIS